MQINEHLELSILQIKYRNTLTIKGKFCLLKLKLNYLESMMYEW